ncbi:MAG: single-stranded-DNA-specific exonuclease RecJ [Chloroflexi bacterium]|nr:single-stranded-DNA-specific exonuclease RecJ [Chloroflexota bacterium]
MKQTHRWRFLPPAPESHFGRFPDLSPLIVQLLYNRGIVEPDDVQSFVAGRLPDDNPFRLPDMSQAVTCLRQAIRTGSPIAVYGDYDADGVAATALLVQTLDALGANVQPYIPHREREGYGLNDAAIRELADRGVGVLVTVDCGVRSVREVALANRLGMKVIITDHHAVGPELPPAVAVVDPKRTGVRYPFSQLAGVGLAFKLAQALLRAHSQVPLPGARRKISEEDLLDLVAMGTIADLAPLVGENRTLVRRGLERLNASQRPGLKALLAAASLVPGQVDAWTVGYVLAPRINAAGRMEDAVAAYRLLTTEDPEEAATLAATLTEVNRQRQEVQQMLIERATEEVLALPESERIFILAGREYRAGVAGLVAGRLTEQFYRPTLVLEQGDELSKGSARSIPEFHITHALDRCADLLLRHGGHSAAAGFTLESRHLPEFAARMKDLAAEALADVDLQPTLDIDAQIPLTNLNWDTLRLIDQMEPFGSGNPRPLFLSEGVTVREAKVVGESHLKLILTDGRVVWDAIAFRQSERAAELAPRVDVVYEARGGEWNNEQRIELVVRDMRAAQ